jgi:hypothetical protein
MIHKAYRILPTSGKGLFVLDKYHDLFILLHFIPLFLHSYLIIVQIHNFFCVLLWLSQKSSCPSISWWSMSCSCVQFFTRSLNQQPVGCILFQTIKNICYSTFAFDRLTFTSKNIVQIATAWGPRFGSDTAVPKNLAVSGGLYFRRKFFCASLPNSHISRVEGELDHCNPLDFLAWGRSSHRGLPYPCLAAGRPPDPHQGLGSQIRTCTVICTGREAVKIGGAKKNFWNTALPKPQGFWEQLYHNFCLIPVFSVQQPSQGYCRLYPLDF